MHDETTEYSFRVLASFYAFPESWQRLREASANYFRGDAFKKIYTQELETFLDVTGLDIQHEGITDIITAWDQIDKDIEYE